MISDDVQLQIVREQLGRVQRALESLRLEIKNPSQFAVLSESYVDMIETLQGEIDAHLGPERTVNGHNVATATGRRADSAQP